LARFQSDGDPVWDHGSVEADFRDQSAQFAVAPDGHRVHFGYLQLGDAPASFDLSTRLLTVDPPAGNELTLAKQEGLEIIQWKNTNQPRLNGKLLPLERNELSRSLAIHPSNDRFVIGSEWWLRAFNASGTLLWSTQVQSDAWDVNITSDGRLVVAAIGDGTIRWHRTEDGLELLAFMPLANRSDWVAWTPEGFYAATPGARGFLRWHVNRGWGEAADSVAIEDIKGSFRPSILPLVLRELEICRALGKVVLDEHALQTSIRINSRLPKEAKLQLLTIGISVYNQENASNLHLQFAERDASDFATALCDTQGSLYAEVCPQVLVNENARKGVIYQALDNMSRSMNKGRGDLAVVHFSGHGVLINDQLYLLPFDVDTHEEISIGTSGIWVVELKSKLSMLADRGRVLVLLDACHSGAIAMDGSELPMNSKQLRASLAAANTMVLTSSSETEVSLERPEWRHGAFTKALIDSLANADTDHDGLIGCTELAEYVDTQVRLLTRDAQTPGLEVRFNSALFAART
jgi:hypothetical protein